MTMTKTIKVLFFTIIATALPLLIVGERLGGGGDDFLFLNLLLIIYTAFRIFNTSEREALNCNIITYLFAYFFLGVAPRAQFVNRINVWGGRPLTEGDYLITTAFVFICLLSYDWFYSLMMKHQFKYKNKDDLAKRIHIWLPTLLSVASVLLTLYIYSSKPILLVYREVADMLGEKEEALIPNTSLSLIYSKFIRPIPVLVLIYYNLLTSKHNQILRSFYIVLILISNFPLALGRNFVAALYIPLLVSYFPQILRKYWIKIVFILSVLIIFPFLNQGRKAILMSDMTIGIDTEMFLQGHFDNFSNLARLLREDTITYGQQLLGVLLFFVPRSIYPDKPISTGGYISELYGLDFDHISMNYWGEGYINFGIVGVFIFSLILAYYNSFFDKAFKQNIRVSSLFQCDFTIYLGLLFFILRGDLMSSFAYTIGMLLSSRLVHWTFLSKRNR